MGAMTSAAPAAAADGEAATQVPGTGVATAAGGTAPTDEERPVEPVTDRAPEPPLPSHFRNIREIATYERYGVPLALLATLGLLLASDIGSGVSVVRQLVPVDDDLFQVDTQPILTASVFTSVKKLWDTGSYALAVLIVVTSISWPFVKLLLTLFAWVAPFSRSYRRRERLLVWLDCLGKWSFVDIVVFLEITVVFRSTVELGGPVVEVFVVPRYGIFGFVCATMLSLILTQHVLRRHRSLIYRPLPPPPPEEEEDSGAVSDDAAAPAPVAVRGLRAIGSLSGWTVLGITGLLVSAVALFVAGVILSIYRVSRQQGATALPPDDYSILKLGSELPTSSEPGSEPRMTWLQIVWFALGVGFPLLSMATSLALLHGPVPRHRLGAALLWTEVAFAWSAAEVFVISTIFTITQIPKFGNGLIQSGCVACYVVDATLLPELGVLAAASLAYIVATVWLLRVAHPAAYRGRLRQPAVAEAEAEAAAAAAGTTMPKLGVEEAAEAEAEAATPEDHGAVDDLSP